MSEQQPPDIVFLDADVPGREAGQLISQLRESPNLRKTPLYVMTGVPGTSPEADGAAGLLRKPFTMDELIRVVQHTVRGTHAPMEPTAI